MSFLSGICDYISPEILDPLLHQTLDQGSSWKNFEQVSVSIIVFAKRMLYT